jgi:Tfp pilus assembly protein PilF
VTALWIVVKYVLLFHVPWPLSADYSYAQILPVSSVADGRLAAVAAALAAAGWLSARSARARAAVIAFVLLILPVANLFAPIGTIMAERLLYLPSVALCWLAGLAFARAWTWRRALAIGAGCAILAAHAAVVIARNADWRSDEILFAATVRTAPQSAKARFNYGSLLAERGDRDKADAHLREAVRIAPAYPEAHNLLGTIALSRGDVAGAEHAFRRALRDSPDYPPALGNLGMVLLRLGRPSEAEFALKRAVARDPSLATAYVNLGVIAERRGAPREAIELYRRAYQLNRSLEVARARAAELERNAAPR